MVHNLDVILAFNYTYWFIKYTFKERAKTLSIIFKHVLLLLYEWKTRKFLDDFYQQFEEIYSRICFVGQKKTRKILTDFNAKILPVKGQLNNI